MSFCWTCGKDLVEGTDECHPCEKCNKAIYCSTDCQTRHWDSGGHKTQCNYQKPLLEFLGSESTGLFKPFSVDQIDMNFVEASLGPRPMIHLNSGSDGTNHESNPVTETMLPRAAGSNAIIGDWYEDRMTETYMRYHSLNDAILTLKNDILINVFEPSVNMTKTLDRSKYFNTSSAAALQLVAAEYKREEHKNHYFNMQFSSRFKKSNSAGWILSGFEIFKKQCDTYNQFLTLLQQAVIKSRETRVNFGFYAPPNNTSDYAPILDLMKTGFTEQHAINGIRLTSSPNLALQQLLNRRSDTSKYNRAYTLVLVAFIHSPELLVREGDPLDDKTPANEWAITITPNALVPCALLHLEYHPNLTESFDYSSHFPHILEPHGWSDSTFAAIRDQIEKHFSTVLDNYEEKRRGRNNFVEGKIWINVAYNFLLQICQSAGNFQLWSGNLKDYSVQDANALRYFLYSIMDLNNIEKYNRIPVDFRNLDLTPIDLVKFFNL